MHSGMVSVHTNPYVSRKKNHLGRSKIPSAITELTAITLGPRVSGCYVANCEARMILVMAQNNHYGDEVLTLTLNLNIKS